MGHPEWGDRVVVDKTRFVREQPGRWMMAVFTREARPGTYVKRIVGLPGDELTIFKGDVFNRGRILTKPVGLLDEILVPVYESGADFADFTEVWRQERGFHRQDATGPGLRLFADPSDDTIILQTRDEITDGYLQSDGVRRQGPEPVGDLEVSFEFRVSGQTHGMEVRLRDGWDRIVVALDRVGPARIQVPGQPVRRATGLRLRAGVDHGLRVSNIDDRLLVTMDSGGPLSFAYDSVNRARATDPDGRRNLVEVRFQGGEVLLRRLRLRRDLHYTDAGHFATRVPVQVKTGTYFVLGDNSENSSDSRDWGLIPRACLIGAPILILWPPGRFRIF